MTWSELMTGDSEATITLDGLKITLRQMGAGALADCCTDSDVDVFAMIAATVTDPPLTAAEARQLKPGSFARLAAECHKVNGTDEALE